MKTAIESAILIDEFKEGFGWGSTAVIWSCIGVGLPLLHMLILYSLPGFYNRYRSHIACVHKVVSPIIISNHARAGRLFEPQSKVNALFNLLEVSGVIPVMGHGIFFIVPFSRHVFFQVAAVVWFSFNVKPICDKSLPAAAYKQIQNSVMTVVKHFHAISTLFATTHHGTFALEDYYSCQALILTLQIVVGVFVSSAVIFHVELVSRLKFLENWQQRRQQVRSESSEGESITISYEVVQQQYKQWKEVVFFPDGWLSLIIYYSTIVSLSFLFVWSVVSLFFLLF